MKKHAFTIPEVLIVIVVIGIIMVMMITIVKPNEKYLRPAYTNTFTNLNNAAFNIKQDANKAYGLFIETDPDKKPTEPILPEDTSFPVEVRDLCKKLAVDPNNMGSKYGYLNTLVNNCSSFKPIELSSRNEDFKDENIAFISSNSMKYYMSDIQSTNYTSSSNNIKFFVVWVDLNGKRKPNTIEWKKNKPADIVPYIITTTGEVVPTGYPTVDLRYLSARVEISDNTQTVYSTSQTFYETQKRAYGSTEYPTLDPTSVNFSKTFPDANFKVNSEDNPVSPSKLSGCNNTAVYMPCSIVIDEFKLSKDND